MSEGFRTILIAHSASPEFPSLREMVASVAPSSSNEAANRESFRTASTLSDALAEIKAGWIPDLVLVYQGVPDEFPQSQIDELIGLVPLVHFIVAFGPWCESIGRTEQRWPIAWCVPLRHLPTRLQQLIVARDSPGLPATASRDEAFSATASRANCSVSSGKLTAAVFGDDRHFVQMVRDQLAASEIRIVEREPDYILLSASQLSRWTESRLRQLREEFPDAERFLLCDLLTPGQVERLEGNGVKPLSQLRFAEEFSAIVTTDSQV